MTEIINVRDLADQYQKNGVVLIKGFLNSELQKTLQQAIEFAVENPTAMFSNFSQSESGRFLFDFLNFRKNNFLKELIFNQELNKKLSSIVGTKTLRFFHDNLLMKFGDAPSTPWHQDRPHYVIDGKSNFSVWMCLDEVNEDNSLAFIPGSHNLGRLFVPQSFKDGSTLGVQDTDFEYLTQEKLSELSPRGIIIFRYQPGDAIVFDNKILHRGLRGPGFVQRRAMSFRYAGDDAFLTRKFIDPTPPMEQLGLKISEGGSLDDVWFPVTYPR